MKVFTYSPALLLTTIFTCTLYVSLLFSHGIDAFSMPYCSLSSSNKFKRDAVVVQALLERRNFIQTIAVSSAILSSSQESASANAAATATKLPMTGAKAPNFELPNSRGEKTTLDTFIQSGKWTVLYFYPGAFTSGCTLEAIGFQRDIEKYRALNAQIVGVSVDPVEKNAQFCTEEKLDFYMLSDFDGKISKLYGSAISIPGFGTFSNRQTYLIDPQGYLRWVFTDVESRVPRHSAEVLEKLQEVQKESA